MSSTPDDPGPPLSLASMDEIDAELKRRHGAFVLVTNSREAAERGKTGWHLRFSNFHAAVGLVHLAMTWASEQQRRLLREADRPSDEQRE